MHQSTGKPAYIPQSWETVPCPFCGSGEYRPYEKYGSELQYTFVQCRQCQLVYGSPRPTYNQHFIDAAYADYYQYSESLTVSDFDKIKQSGTNMFVKELEHLMQFDKKRSAVLDIGSGVGTFLYAAKPHYPVAIGLDVSEKMAAFVKKAVGVDVHLAQFEDFSYPGKFSLIHMSHVMEHIPNPNEWLQKAKSLLDTDGILVINVPHCYSLGSRLQHFYVKLGLKKQFSDTWTDPTRTPDHLFEPVIPAMKQLLDRNGFEILDYFTYSRKDPASNQSLASRFTNRFLHWGSNLSFITRVRS